MRLSFLLFFVLLSCAHTASIDRLLKEYENSSKNSLSTLDEKMGHVIVYTQKELQFMQYDTLSELLRELPITNINTNKHGMNTLSLTGSKTDVTGFFRLYINDHEVSSIYNQSPSLNWIDMPMDMIDHVEIYYGEGSFSLGNETGVQFIRVYTKNPQKENGNEVNFSSANKGNNSQSFTQSSFLKSDWSYLFHGTNQNKEKQIYYKNSTIEDDSNRKYFFFNARNSSNNIDIGYTKLKKDSYLGYATDLISNDGQVVAQSLFVNINSYFSADKSLKTSFSIDIEEKEYFEKNDQGLFIPPVIDLSNIPASMPKEYHENTRLIKLNARISKETLINNHNLFGALNYKEKRYKTKKRDSTTLTNTFKEIGELNDFDKEQIFSVMFQDDYAFNEKLHLVGNFKVDHYERESLFLKDTTEYLYRVGAIYLPHENLGFKSFYTKSYIPPSFYNMDFATNSNQTIKTQEYKYFTLEGAYTFGNSKLNIDYYNVKIEDFVYYTPVGFINIEEDVKTSGFIFDYEYTIDTNHKLKLNYYTSKLNQNINNSSKGGYIKYMGEYKSIDYFSSLIYKNDYKYMDVSVKESYNLNLGATYNHSKSLSFSLKGKNLLQKPTKTLVTDSSNGFNNQTHTAFADYDRSVVLSFRWLF